MPKARLQALKDSVEIPAIKTEEDKAKEVAESRDTLKKSWMPFLDKIELIDKINIPDPTDGTKVLETVDMPENWRKEVREELLDSILEGGINPTEETIKVLIQEREKEFIYKNLPQLYKLWENKIKSQAIEERDKLLHNDNPPNNNVRPDGKPATANEGFDKWI